MKTIKFLFFFLLFSSFSAFAEIPTYWAYWDNDLDGHASKMKQITAEQVTGYIDAGWFVVDHKPFLDCDDNNDLVFHSIKAWIDIDGDKFSNGYAQLCIGSSMPTGYSYKADVLGFTDCDDTNPLIWQKMWLYVDADGDLCTSGAGAEFCVGLPPTYPANHIDKASIKGWADCNDADPAVYRNACVRLAGTIGKNTTMCVGDVAPAGYEFCPRGGVPPEAELNYSVFPNPVTDRLNITPNDNWNSRVEIRLIDQFGRVTKVVNNPSATKGQAITVNTGDLKPGIYNLTIKSGEIMSTKQIGIKL